MFNIFNRQNKEDPPMPLPTGMSEFYTWADRIIAKVGPLADKDSLRFVLASNIMHLSPQEDKIRDSYFIAALRKAAANQVASQVFQDIKATQAAAAEARAAKPSEDTPAHESVPSNAQKAE